MKKIIEFYVLVDEMNSLENNKELNYLRYIKYTEYDA